MNRIVMNIFMIVTFIPALVFSIQAYAQDSITQPAREQLPRAMHTMMDERPVIRVGQTEGDFRGTDQRVLQAAVDYIASLGGGKVIIGPGTYSMHDSLHLRSNVHVIGTPGKTILQKTNGVVTPLEIDGDFGEEQITVADPEGFRIGSGVAIWDQQAQGFHITVATITGRTGNTFSLSKPLMADCMIHRGAQTATVYPVVSGYHIENAHVEHLIIDGNRENNTYLNGCRGGGIFLFRGFASTISHCLVKNYNGDGISFQQSNDVTVEHCTTENNSDLGFHPGSGSQRPRVAYCVARNNGTDGLFLCWRVRYGVFEQNVLEANGRFGISIGHKDTDNLIQSNTIQYNASNGIFFRNETIGMAPHRNRIIGNQITANGNEPGTAAIRIRGAVSELTFEHNRISDPRDEADQTQTVGFLIEDTVGTVMMNDNTIEAQTSIDDRRPND